MRGAISFLAQIYLLNFTTSCYDISLKSLKNSISCQSLDKKKVFEVPTSRLWLGLSPFCHTAGTLYLRGRKESGTVKASLYRGCSYETFLMIFLNIILRCYTNKALRLWFYRHLLCKNSTTLFGVLWQLQHHSILETTLTFYRFLRYE